MQNINKEASELKQKGLCEQGEIALPNILSYTNAVKQVLTRAAVAS